MNAAFETYLALSNELLSDGEYLLGLDEKDIRWQRNFVRTVVPIIEGYSHCLRQIATIGVDLGARELPKKERVALLGEEEFGLCDRIKLTLRGTYKMLAIEPAPDFGTENWKNATEGLEKRNALMHPKIPGDLEIDPESWTRMHSGLTWLFEQHSNLVKFLYERHGKRCS